MGPDVRSTPCWDLTDVTLADEDTNNKSYGGKFFNLQMAGGAI